VESGVFELLASQGAMIERLAADSRRCGPGVAFFAWPGESGDGRAHIADALARGAGAVVWEAQGWQWPSGLRAPNVAVSDLRDQAGALASAFYGHPSQALWTCGVTGTNGKTSCSQWLAALLAASGVRSGVIGTLGSGFPGALAPLANTTPDALEMQGLLADLRGAGAQAVAMEVSSHGLVQGRVNGIAFDCALFTNLSHDHLDYHGTLEAYARAKSRLFETEGLGCAVLNLDDVLGVRLAQQLSARGVRTIGYSLSAAGVAPGGTSEFVAARSIAQLSDQRGDAVLVRIASSWGDAEVLIAQLGQFNIANALGVLGCLIAKGVPFAEAAARLAELPAVPGRMQRFGGGAQPLVVVDFAHTPDALEKTLAALRPVARARGGSLAAVFGAGGDRDPTKRAPMGAAAARLADRVLLTSDNPRGEDPRAIIDAIAAGAAGGAGAAGAAALEIDPDRARAIEHAVRSAAPQDVILVAGKGHEAYQEIAGKRLPFSDAQAVERALAARAGTQRGSP
jgi:UDP-N-acetylmuramoyl-L-alanyl-D-glutamate--2,6-diaminopimelate ligase